MYRSGSEWRSVLGKQSYRALERGLLKMEKPQNEVPWKESKKEEGILNHWVRLWGDVFLFEEKIDTNQQSDNMGNRERTRKL